MKFQELKNRYKNRYTMRMVTGVLFVALLGGSIGIGSMQAGAPVTMAEAAVETAADKEETEDAETAESEQLADDILKISKKDSDEAEDLDGKEETVYLITDANGKVTKTIVSNWLKNGSARSEIKDVSNLSDIENVKGDETFTQDGSNLTWQANGEDIFYQGTTTEETPITEEVTYFLDGTEISPEELAGKSGEVTIRFDYTNHEKKTVTVNGKEEEVYVPFTVVSGLIFDDSFRNVQVNHGRVISDGNRNAVIGFAMPGLKESLNVKDGDFDEDFEFPEYVEITADVENFSLEMTATLAIPGLLAGEDVSANVDFDELDDVMDQMTDAMDQLKDGGGQLADGLDTLNDSMGEFSSGVSQLSDGVNAYTDGATQLAQGIQTLSDSSGSLESGVNTLNASAKTISNGVQQLDQTLRTEMSKKEKAAAKQQVDAAIDAQFKKGSDTYNMIYNAATENFQNTMSGEETVNTVQAGIQSGLQAQGLTSEGVIAALAQYYAANGFTDGTGQYYAPEVCQSIIEGTETPYALYFANQVLNGGLSSALAGGITSGIAQQGAAAVGESVVGACASAAKQAGEEAVITGAESAKKQVAAAIEAKDANSGYSLVTGSKALSDGTQTLANSIPTLKDGIGRLLSGANQLVSNNAALKDGVSALSDGASQISDGVVKLDDGAHELADGLEEFDEKAISKIVDAYNGDIKDLVDRLEAIAQAGDDYTTFSGAAEDTDTMTKFIFRTAAISADDEDEE